MPSRLAAACATTLLLLLLPARAQNDDRLVTTPPLEQAFPIEAKFGDIKLQFPVLVNSQTVLGPDVTLRSIYIDPNAGMSRRGGGGGGGNHGDGSGGGGGHHHHGAPADGDSDDDLGGGGSPSPTPTPALSSAPAGGNSAATKEQQGELWHDVDSFQQALHGANSLGTMLVYARTGEKPHAAEIDLPGGMLLAEVSGHIQVLALTADSEAATAGLQPGDQIQTVGETPVTTLRDFSKLYFTTTQQARKNGKSYSIQVARPGTAAPVTIQVGAPPSLMHMF